MPENIILTGATGLVGKDLLHKLKALDYNVITVSRSAASDISVDMSTDGFEEQFESLDLHNNVKAIIHLAGQATVWKSWKDPLNDADSNIKSTINALQLARKLKTSKFIFFSSESVYGNLVRPNEFSEKQPVNPYGISKLTAENYVKVLCKKYHIEHMILRPSFVLGKGMSRNLIYDILQLVKEGNDISIPFTDDSAFNFVDVDYVSKVVIKTISSKFDFEDMNVIGEEVNVKDLISKISLAMDIEFSVEYGDVNRIASLQSCYERIIPYDYSLISTIKKVI